MSQPTTEAGRDEAARVVNLEIEAQEATGGRVKPSGRGLIQEDVARRIARIEAEAARVSGDRPDYATTWAAFEAYESLAAANGSGMTRDQMTGAAMMLGWLCNR